MKSIGAAKFKEQCLALLDRLDADGLVVTKHGKPVARVVPYDNEGAELIGSLRHKIRSRATCLRPAFAGTLMLNLDTHILIFALAGELRPAEQSLLSRGRWSISSIVLWELAKLVQLGRLDLDLDDREVVRILSRLQVWPIDLAWHALRTGWTLAETRRTRSSPRRAWCTTSRCSRAMKLYGARRWFPWHRRRF